MPIGFLILIPYLRYHMMATEELQSEHNMLSRPQHRPQLQWLLYQHLLQDCFTSLQAGTQRQMVVVIRLLPATGTPVTASITVYAQWTANPGYTVTYNSGWGTSVDAQYVIPPATTVGTLPTSPTKPCYTFGGWYTATHGGGAPFTASTPVTADITVYAQWTWVGWPGGITPSTYAIGDPGPSCVGKVFYITNGGKNGLEAAPSGWYNWYSADADPSLYWISGDPDEVAISRLKQL